MSNTFTSEPDESAIFYLASSIMAYSHKFNPRLLESCTHPLWSNIITKLCQDNHKLLWPSPQWCIYISPQDHIPFDETTSHHTTPDSKAVAVIPDFCILLPVFKNMKLEEPNLSPDLSISDIAMLPQWVRHQWNNYMDKTDLAYMTIPVLVELKRPITRSSSNVMDYLNCVFARLDEAQEQAIQQATCLFCSVKYGIQREVILIAASGEWWSFQKLARKSVKRIFDQHQYQARWGGRHQEDIDYMFGETLSDLDQEHLVSSKEAKTKAKAKLLAKKNFVLEGILARMRGGNSKVNILKKPKNYSVPENSHPQQHDENQDLQNVIYDLEESTKGQKVYSEADILKASLAATMSNLIGTLNTRVLFDVPQGEESFKELKWSPITRLGSKASDFYMNEIQNFINSSAGAYK